MSAKRWGVAAGDVEHWTSFADVVAGAPLVQEAGGDDGISLSDTHEKEPRALKLPTTTKLAVRQTPDFARLGEIAPRFAEAVKENLRRIGAARSLNERILGAVRSAIVRAQAPTTVYGANGRTCTAGRAGTIRAGAISVNTSI